MMATRHRRLTSWIAICAILLNTLAPAISHALAGQRGLAWTEICTAAGIVARITPDELRKDHQPARHAPVAFEHCPYCASHGASFAPPPAPAPEVSLAGRPQEPATVVPLARFEATTWSAALPRAPPRVA